MEEKSKELDFIIEQLDQKQKELDWHLTESNKFEEKINKRIAIADVDEGIELSLNFLFFSF